MEQLVTMTYEFRALKGLLVGPAPSFRCFSADDRRSRSRFTLDPRPPPLGRLILIQHAQTLARAVATHDMPVRSRTWHGGPAY